MSEKTASIAEPGAPRGDSVFDFLYHDSRRVGSFLAQFDAGGHLQQVRQSDSEGRSSNTKTTGAGEGGVPLVGKVGLSYERAVGEQGDLSQERVYDPFWTNACSFLDFLEDKRLIRRGLADAGIGQFVLLQGSVALLDLSVAKSFWNVPQFQEYLVKGMIAAGSVARSGVNPKQVEKENRELGKLMFTLLERMPHGLQMRISVASGELVWCGLQPESLAGSPIEIAFKHGIAVPGQWNVLGILDAIPDSGAEGADANGMGPRIGPQEVVAKLMETYVPVMRLMMGRPVEAYGITPLLVFRQVGRG